MKVRTTQLVDYWIGIPLCVMLTCWRFIWDRVLPRKTKPVQRVLFIELSEMGSAILAYSSLMQLKASFPNAELFFLIFRRNRESVEVLEVIPKARVLTIDERSFLRFIVSTLWVIVRLRWLRIDTALDLELFSRCTTLLSYLSGAVRRVGFHNYTGEGLYRGNLLTHPVYYNPHRHMSLNFAALVGALSAPSEEVLLKADMRGEIRELPRYELSEEKKNALLRLLAASGGEVTGKTRIVVLNPDPGAVLPIRGWPIENFAALARDVLALHPELTIVIMGLKESAHFSDRIIAPLSESERKRVIDYTGKTQTLRDVLDLLSVSRVLVTNDSGPAHLAALTNTMTVVFFGPETPALYAPVGPKVRPLYSYYACSPCLSAFNHRRTNCRNNRCLQAISKEEPLSHVREAVL